MGTSQVIAAATLVIATTDPERHLLCSRPTVETFQWIGWFWKMEVPQWLLEPTDIATTAIATVLATAAADREKS